MIPFTPSQLLLLSVPIIPLLLTFAVASLRGRGVGVLCCLAALPALAAALFLPAGTHVDLPWILLGSGIYLDGIGKIFLLFIAILYLSASLYALGYMEHDAHRRRFFIFFLAAMTGNFGVLVAQDIALFYLFFALMSFSAYVLVIHNGDPEAMRAGRVYIVLVLLGEVLIFAGLLLIAQAAASLDIFEGAAALAVVPAQGLILAMLIAGFGIKAGLVPLHLWLPLAHPVAPTPASAVLSGAMIKTGLFGLMRFLPLGYAALPGWGAALVVAGLVGIFYGVLVGLTQQEAKTVLAYSSISQMGFLLFGLGLGLAAPEYWPELALVVSLYALHHGLAKGALFLGVGVAPAAGRKMPGLLVGAGLVWPALALGGAPFTSGILAKSAMKPHLTTAPPPWPDWSGPLLTLAAVGTTILMGRYLFLLRQKGGGAHGPNRSMLGAWGVLVAVSAVVPWLLPATPELRLEALEPVQIAGALWPVLLGGALIWIGWRGGGRRAGTPAIPPGDLVVLVEGVCHAAAPSPRSRISQGPLPEGGEPSPLRASPFLLARLERCLSGWTAIGVLFILLILLQFLFFILL